MLGHRLCLLGASNRRNRRACMAVQNARVCLVDLPRIEFSGVYLLHLSVWMCLSRMCLIASPSRMPISTPQGLDDNSEIAAVWFLSKLSVKFSDVNCPYPHAHRTVTWYEVCLKTQGVFHFPLCVNLESQRLSRHSFASHEATHIHTCNPAAVENIVASIVAQ